MQKENKTKLTNEGIQEKFEEALNTFRNYKGEEPVIKVLKHSLNDVVNVNDILSIRINEVGDMDNKSIARVVFSLIKSCVKDEEIEEYKEKLNGVLDLFLEVDILNRCWEQALKDGNDVRKVNREYSKDLINIVNGMVDYGVETMLAYWNVIDKLMRKLDNPIGIVILKKFISTLILTNARCLEDEEE